MPPVPAKRYDIFITAFEKYVGEKQKEIKKVDGLMKPYEIVRGVLERFKLKNDTKLDLQSTGVRVGISVTDDDRWELFNSIISSIGEELKLAKLHPTGDPTTNHSGLRFHFYWRLRGISDTQPPDVDFVLNIPSNGTKHIAVTWTNETYTGSYRQYKAVWQDYIEPKVTHDGDEIQF